jgi:OmpA-OmpF porin, OOP family
MKQEETMNKIKIVVVLAMMVLMAANVGWAGETDKEGSQDHTLFSRISGFYISSYKVIDFDQHTFETDKGRLVVEGHKYEIIYHQKKGAKTISTLQKVRNYVKAAKKIGGEILQEKKSRGSMKVQKGKKEIYAQISCPYGVGSYLLVIVEKGEMKQEVEASLEAFNAMPRKRESNVTVKKEDTSGSKDHPLLSRIPDFYISAYKDTEFGKHTFETAKGKESVEGRVFAITYHQQKGAQAVSNIQKVRNYMNAIKKIGGEVLKEKDSSASMKVLVDNQEVWIKVSNPYGAGSYLLNIVEKGAMEQEVTADADAMLEDIQNTGHVAVYGIHFDTGKAILKASSAPALKEITRLLKKNPKLNIYVVGHTDMVGKFVANITLANDRAKAVVSELTSKYKISTKRLTPKGVGPLCPVDSNRSKEGKAKNRRVDLVEKI